MKPTISIALIILGLTLCPPAQAFWWSLTDEEQQICESRAANKRTSFAAQQAFERCKKGIRAELKEREERRARAAAEQAAAEAAETRVKAERIEAAQELIPAIKKSCLSYLPQRKELEQERDEKGENGK